MRRPQHRHRQQQRVYCYRQHTCRVNNDARSSCNRGSSGTSTPCCSVRSSSEPSSSSSGRSSSSRGQPQWRAPALLPLHLQGSSVHQPLAQQRQAQQQRQQEEAQDQQQHRLAMNQQRFLRVFWGPWFQCGVPSLKKCLKICGAPFVTTEQQTAARAAAIRFVCTVSTATSPPVLFISSQLPVPSADLQMQDLELAPSQEKNMQG